MSGGRRIEIRRAFPVCFSFGVWPSAGDGGRRVETTQLELGCLALACANGTLSRYAARSFAWHVYLHVSCANEHQTAAMGAWRQCRRSTITVGRANLAKILSCRIDPPTSLVYGGGMEKGEKKKQSPEIPRCAR